MLSVVAGVWQEKRIYPQQKKAVSVTEMHAWLKENPGAFIAAIRA